MVGIELRAQSVEGRRREEKHLRGDERNGRAGGAGVSKTPLAVEVDHLGRSRFGITHRQTPGLLSRVALSAK
jgi:hypothetical protein